MPWEMISPETLTNMVEEFVSREWADLRDGDFTLEDKVAQVMQQLKAKKVKVVFDFTTETGNIVVC